MNLKLIIIIMAVIVFLTSGLVVFVLMKNKNKYEVIEDEIQETKVKPIKASKKINTKKVFKQEVTNGKNIKNRISSLTYYDEYIMNKKEKLMWSAVGIGVIFVVGYIFYKHIIWAALLSLIGLKYPAIKTKEIIQKRKEKLLLQFKEALYSISASLSAGKSVENSFREAGDEIALIFGEGKDIYILEELRNINRKLDVNQSIEEALKDFAERSGLEEIQTFSDIFESCKRTGGNLNKVIQNSCQVIGDKIEIKQEILVLISGKKFESRILTVIPFVLVALMGVMAPDLLQNLYTNIGRVLSTVALIIIGISTLWASKIMNIEV